MSGSTPTHQLVAWLRVALGAFGLALLTFGTLAVFATDNEVGAASLLAAGLVAMLLCLLGRMPTSVKVGTVEVLMAQAVKAEDSGDVEGAEALKSAALATTRELAAPARGRLRDAPAYEYAVLKVFPDVIGSDARIALEAVPERGAVDAIVYSGDRAVAIEIRAGTAFRPRDLLPRLDMATREEALGLTGVLIVVQAEGNDPVVEALRAAARSLRMPVRVVGWLPDTPPDQVRLALHALLVT